MDNISRQFEEVEVLTSIYGDDWCIDDEGWYHIKIESKPVQLTLFIETPESYPSESPPYFRIDSTSLIDIEVNNIANILQEVYLENIGETVIFQWVERIREWVQEKASNLHAEPEIWTEEADCGRDATNCYEEEAFSLLCSQLSTDVNISNCPTSDKKSSFTDSVTIIHGDPITYKKSTFQGHAAIIRNPKESEFVLRQLMENKKIAHATHNIQAYRIFKEPSNTYDENFEDDGEKQAGHRLLHLLQVMNVRNVMVVVTRWFGGVLLGPDRFRCINDAARQVLDKANLVPARDVKKKK